MIYFEISSAIRIKRAPNFLSQQLHTGLARAGHPPRKLHFQGFQEHYKPCNYLRGASTKKMFKKCKYKINCILKKFRNAIWWNFFLTRKVVQKKLTVRKKNQILGRCKNNWKLSALNHSRFAPVKELLLNLLLFLSLLNIL